MDERSALLVVDMQNDFLPGGALAVSEGNVVIPRLNDYMRRFHRAGAPIFASRDWHPPETTHFRARGGPWPPHCVQNTPGAEFHPDMAFPNGQRPVVVLSKGMGAEEDAYSAFQARDDGGRLLAEWLHDRGVKHLYVGGLALDYCVKASVLDALNAGFEATLLIDATRAVNVRPHDGEEAVEELVRAGAHIATLETFERA